MTNELAVFVDGANGDDAATGTRERPFRSIGAALAKRGAKSLVYVCEGVYAEAVEITAPVSLLGGVACNWQPSAAQPRIAPTSGIGLRIVNVSGAVVVKDLEIAGSARKDVPGDSAIAAFVSASTNVTLKNVTLKASEGTPGKSGEAPASNYAAPTASSGGAASGASAGIGPTCVCTNGDSSKGGNGANGTGAGFEAGSSTPLVGTLNPGTSNLASCTEGTVGANGEASASDVAGELKGALNAEGWTSAPLAMAGKAGRPGQGGGGGGAKTQTSAAGGGGACGGCGGSGGQGGGGGGSSFALLSFKSSVTLAESKLVTATAGAGGSGHEGETGQDGGGAGPGAGCNGGAGGKGSGGNGGSGGAGGHSVPVGFVGTPPTVGSTQLVPGAFGAGGQPGKGGLGAGKPGVIGDKGPDGTAQNTLEL